MGLPSTEKRIQKRRAEIDKLERLMQKKEEQIEKARSKHEQLETYDGDDLATTKYDPDGAVLMLKDVLHVSTYFGTWFSLHN